MADQDKENPQEDVEVNLYAEEALTYDNAPKGSLDEDITIDFGETADSLLADIKSDSLYELNRDVANDEIEPDEITAAEAVINVDEVSNAAQDRGTLADNADLDEPAESIHIEEERPERFVEYDQVDEEEEERKAQKSRRRLRRVLVFFIIVLVVLAAAIGVFIWQNSASSDVKKPDSEALQTSNAGITTIEFQPIPADQVPDLVTYFGMTPQEAADASNNQIALDAEAVPASDPDLPQVVSTRNGWIVGSGGETLASFTFGLNGEGRINYIVATFDLDAFGVADARFDELASDKTVAASILQGIGLGNDVVDSAQLTISGNPQAVIARDSAGQEVAEFTGVTNIEGVPSTWKVTETYDHTAGISLGDNSVIRTLSVDLR